MVAGVEFTESEASVGLSDRSILIGLAVTATKLPATRLPRATDNHRKSRKISEPSQFAE